MKKLCRFGSRIRYEEPNIKFRGSGGKFIQYFIDIDDYDDLGGANIFTYYLKSYLEKKEGFILIDLVMPTQNRAYFAEAS